MKIVSVTLYLLIHELHNIILRTYYVLSSCLPCDLQTEHDLTFLFLSKLFEGESLRDTIVLENAHYVMNVGYRGG